jgi:hypothetical protein
MSDLGVDGTAEGGLGSPRKRRLFLAFLCSPNPVEGFS